jgi:lipoate-protein ligase B
MKILNLGITNYQQAHELQKTIINQRLNNQIEDTVITVEHPLTITLGRDGKRENILVNDEVLKEKSISVFYIDRGGDVTLHCPGQLVMYPIIDLKQLRPDLHWYMRILENTVIELLTIYGINAYRKENYTGVWVSDEKIASIGIGVRNWITYHGLSLNIEPDLDYFSLIYACGLKNVKMTSMKKLLGVMLNKFEIERILVKIFEKYIYDTNS